MLTVIFNTSGPSVVPPAAPTGLTATGEPGQILLNWNPSAGATTYNIYRSTLSGGELLYVSGVSAISYIDTSVVPGVTYYYTVTAVNGAGESGFSNEAFAAASAPVVSHGAPVGVGIRYFEPPPRRPSKKKLIAKERERIAKLLGIAVAELEYEEFLENESIEVLLLS